MRSWASLVVLVCGCFHGSRWPSGPLHVALACDDGPVGCSAAASRAVRTWADALARFGVDMDVGTPGDITITWARLDEHIRPEVLAYTELDKGIGGELVSAYIYLQPNYVWSVGTECLMQEPYPFDLESVVAHELGHALGLPHIDKVGATMVAGIIYCDVTKRTPDDDDLAELASIYAEETP